MEHAFPTEKQDYRFNFPVIHRNFPWERPIKVWVPSTSRNRNFPEFLCQWKAPFQTARSDPAVWVPSCYYDLLLQQLQQIQISHLNDRTYLWWRLSVLLARRVNDPRQCKTRNTCIDLVALGSFARQSKMARRAGSFGRCILHWNLERNLHF